MMVLTWQRQRALKGTTDDIQVLIYDQFISIIILTFSDV